MNDTDPPGDPATGAPAPHPSADEPVLPVPVAPVEAGPVAASGPAAAAAPGGTRRSSRAATVGAVVLAVALAFGGGFLAGRTTAPVPGDGVTAGIGATPSPVAAPGSSAPAPTPTASAAPDLPSDGNRLGRADARLVVEYWADFQCPFCGKFAEETIPLLLPYIEDGTIALVHRDYAFLGPESTDAAIAVRCADREGKYWPMHDAVYAAQDGENQGAFARDRLVTIGESVGLDGTALEACLDDRSVLAGVLDDTSAGMRVGIASTPTLDVNGTRFTGVPDFAKVEAAIAAAVAGASPAPLPTKQPLSDPWATLPTDGRTAGSASAPVTVALWMDYQATGSGAVAQLGDELRSRVAGGSVRLELHDLALLGEESVTAAVALRCIDAQGGPAWFVHDVLSSSARGADSGLYTPPNLLRLAAQLGLDVVAFNACLDDPAPAADVAADTAAGRTAGLADAPALVISTGGREVDRFSGALDTAKVLAAIDAAAK